MNRCVKMSKVGMMMSKLKVWLGFQDKYKSCLYHCLCGIRHRDGVNLIQAFMRNVRNCRSDEKGRNPSEDLIRMRVPMQDTEAD